MNRDAGGLTEWPRLSAEALALILRRDEAPVVDLRPMLALEREYRPAIIRAALAWNLPPERIEV